jgi:hypothetical protein
MCCMAGAMLRYLPRVLISTERGIEKSLGGGQVAVVNNPISPWRRLREPGS